MDKETIEIRWHGRGGQGAVTASKMLAQAALAEGKFFQGMPDYGAERMGAPVKAFTRVSSQPIKLYCQVTEPDIVAFYEQYKETLDAQGLSLQDVRDTLGQEILQQKRSEVYSGFLQTLRAKATIADPK